MPLGVDFVKSMNDSERLKGLVTPDAMASGGVLPQATPVMQAMGMVKALVTAIPDLSFDIEQTTVSGDQATVRRSVGHQPTTRRGRASPDPATT